MKRFVDLEECGDSATGKRFRFIEDNELETKIRGRIPANTAKSTRWAVGVWNTWADERNKLQLNPEVPMVPLLEGQVSSSTKRNLPFWLSRFVFEIRKQNGKPYPGDTLWVICSGVRSSAA